MDSMDTGRTTGLSIALVWTNIIDNTLVFFQLAKLAYETGKTCLLVFDSRDDCQVEKS